MADLPQNCVLTPEVRLSHAKLLEPAPDLNGNLKYSVVLLIPKTTDVSGIRAAINAAVQKGVKDKWRGYLPPNVLLPLQDGDMYAAQKPEKRQAYLGNYYINTKQDPKFSKPVVLNEAGVRCDDPTVVQSGDYAIVVVEFVPYDEKGSQGVTAIPKVIRKVRTGEHFGGGVSEAAALAAVGGETRPEIAAAMDLGSLM